MTQKQRDRLEMLGAAVFLGGCIAIWPPLALLAFGVVAVLYANFKSDETARPAPTEKESGDAPAN